MMKFAEFLTEGEVIAFKKKETLDFKKLYDELKDEHPPKSNSMERLSTYYSESADKYFVSYEGFLSYKDGDYEYHDAEYAAVYEAKFKDGKWTGIHLFASDDTVNIIIKDLKKLHDDLKKVD